MESKTTHNKTVASCQEANFRAADESHQNVLRKNGELRSMAMDGTSLSYAQFVPRLPSVMSPRVRKSTKKTLCRHVHLLNGAGTQTRRTTAKMS